MRGVHDQLFKELAIAFPADTVRLMLPDIAERIVLEEVRFYSPECFIDSRRGFRRYPDLVAEVRGLQPPHEEALLHLEVFYRFRSASRFKLLEYNHILAVRYGVPAHSAVLYIRGGLGGRRHQVLRQVSLGRPILFRYDSLGLSQASAAEYLERPEPLAWAYAALMRPEPYGSRAELALECLRRIGAAQDLDSARRHLLVNCVRGYVESDPRVIQECEALLRSPANQEVDEMMVRWDEKMKAKGMQELLERMLTQRFGPLPSRIRQKIAALRSIRELQRLADQVLQVNSLQELAFD